MADETLLDQGDAVSFPRQQEGAAHADQAPADDGNGARLSHGNDFADELLGLSLASEYTRARRSTAVQNVAPADQ
ncbi:hypothetical protein [Mesorhizobium sp. AR02]|uniref:hypothetical protein n=1 Tax=Mesorhizobium sp. AR02 TaxID=2865837 RepID=UPI0021600853|nr:hypothetical protein [Mesorhizobium sp. AR02]